MKRKLLLLSILSFVLLVIPAGGGMALNGYFGGGSGSENIHSVTLTEGLVGYWNFDEGTGTTAFDSYDSNNDGSLCADSFTAFSTWVQSSGVNTEMFSKIGLTFDNAIASTKVRLKK